MRNMIFKTLFASILGSLLVAPLAHADRQGGGTLRAMNLVQGPDMLDSIAISDIATAADIQLGFKEWVRFTQVESDKVTFDYVAANAPIATASRITLTRSDLESYGKGLAKALLTSKTDRSWKQVD